ncbi:chaplin [Streptomyces sp. MS1.AVA.1]|uniref:Chaplin n=1 Tax=Streptomyces machairae TaxID=3134109 RepID=A0ABU8UG76_9ACTN
MSGRQGTYETGYPIRCDRRRRLGRDGCDVPGVCRLRGGWCRGRLAGLLSGNTVQLPVHVPVNVCGNTVNVVGLLNPAVGNTCVNEDGGGKKRAASHSGASAQGRGKDSPGIASGNVVELPVHLPVNVSGNSVNVVGVGNAAIDNESVNGPGDRPSDTTKPAPKPARPGRTSPGRPRPRPSRRGSPRAPSPTRARTRPSPRQRRAARSS